jgi:hypothetical protein
MDGDAVEMEIPLQSSAVDGAEVASLPSSPRAAQADGTVELPYVAPSCSLAIQAKRALLVRNALVASNGTVGIWDGVGSLAFDDGLVWATQ